MNRDMNDMILVNKASNEIESLKLMLEVCKELNKRGQMTDESYDKNLNYILDKCLDTINESRRI